MKFTIAIQPDRGRLADGSCQWADGWAVAIRTAGHAVRMVDVRRPDIFRQLTGCRALMWRHAHVASDRMIARSLLPAIERHLKLEVYPDQNTCWHYDDKIAQFYLFEALGIPAPRTWVFWRQSDAVEFCRQADYPLVFKLRSGASAENVRLLRNPDEVEPLVAALFGRGLHSLAEYEQGSPRLLDRAKNAARWLLKGHKPHAGDNWELQKDYIYFQEFLPDNTFDTRLMIVGNRVFAFRRFNRPGDFRASGSGAYDLDPRSIDPRFVRLAFRIAQAIGSQSLAIDALYRDGEPVVSEISYTHLSIGISVCPGHWEIVGPWDEGDLVWHPGQLFAHDLMVDDLLQRIERRLAVASGA